MSTQIEIKHGQLLGLNYALFVVEMRRSGSVKLPAYLAALDDVELFLRAAIERLAMGKEMHSVTSVAAVLVQRQRTDRDAIASVFEGVKPYEERTGV